MARFIISDMHLDDSTGPFTKFGNKQKLIDFLDLVGSEPLIISSDGLDLWAWTLDKILAANADIAKRLQDHPAPTCLPGNQDLGPDKINDLFPKANVATSPGLNGWVIFHGYQCDPELNTAWKHWFVDEADRLVHNLNDPSLSRLANWAGNSTHANKPLVKALERTQRKYILGHSHTADDLGWFVNEGCWCDKNPSYALMDDDGKIALKS